MPDRPLFTLEAALNGQNKINKTIANPAATPTPTTAKLRLFKATLVPETGTTRDDFIAAECDFVGYPVGGYTITGFADANKAPLGGAVSTSNLINVVYASGVGDTCGGYWLEDSSTPTPEVRDSFVYDPARPILSAGDGWPIAVQMGYGAN